MFKKFLTATLAAATLIAVSSTTTQAAPSDDIATNIAVLVSVAPALCDQVDATIAAGGDPVAFIPIAVDEFAETHANAVGIELLTEFLHGLLVGCAAH